MSLIAKPGVGPDVLDFVTNEIVCMLRNARKSSGFFGTTHTMSLKQQEVIVTPVICVGGEKLNKPS